MIEKLLSNKKNEKIYDIIIKHTDLSLITKQDLKIEIVKKRLDSI
ncbi:MAG: hypothetical protein PHW82_16475 [Bacteroidales bacterium]|nr:hypothetical protein [Bacteroidales bacterium]